MRDPELNRENLARARPDIRAFEQALVDLAALLGGGQFITAARIAAEQKCSKMVAYRRLRTLSERGHVLQTQLVREGISGPFSVAYAIVSTKRSRLFLTTS